MNIPKTLQSSGEKMGCFNYNFDTDEIKDIYNRAWDLVHGDEGDVTQNKLNKAWELICDLVEVDTVSCADCGACGHDPCCSPTRCKYLNVYKNNYLYQQSQYYSLIEAIRQAKMLADLSVKIQQDSKHDPDWFRKIVECGVLQVGSDSCHDLVHWLEYLDRMEHFERTGIYPEEEN